MGLYSRLHQLNEDMYFPIYHRVIIRGCHQHKTEMATLHPFRAVRPLPQFAAEIASVPYDVISVSEARRLAEGKPHSFLHVIRPEIDLPIGIDEHDDEVYKKGADNLRQFVDGEHSLQEEDPSLFVYRQIMNGRHQTGIFGCVSVAEYDDDTILKHEKTRPVKEDDRTQHILTQKAHAEPVMLTFRGTADIDAVVEQAKGEQPLYDFIAPDGIQHTLWKVEAVDTLVQAFKAVESLYVADGHHRCKAASRAAAESKTEDLSTRNGEINYFPAVLFPMSEMKILPYNRIVYSIPPNFRVQLSTDLEVKEKAVSATPKQPGTICMYLNGEWMEVTLPVTEKDSVVDTLDVARLSEFILEPLLGISDPRTDSNINFVGGIRGTEELERLVDSGEAQLAISMYATSIEELVAVSDARLLMPPKSTWFEPKLRSGLLVHLF